MLPYESALLINKIAAQVYGSHATVHRVIKTAIL